MKKSNAVEAAVSVVRELLNANVNSFEITDHHWHDEPNITIDLMSDATEKAKNVFTGATLIPRFVGTPGKDSAVFVASSYTFPYEKGGENETN